MSDPLFYHPQPNPTASVSGFRSPVASNWVNQRLSKQTNPGNVDQKEAIAVCLFSNKIKAKSAPNLSIMVPSSSDDEVKLQSKTSLII